MADTYLALTEPSFQKSTSWSARCHVKVFVLLSLLIGLGFALFQSGAGVPVQEPTVNMAWQHVQPARATQFMQPGTAWQSMKQMKPRQFMQPVAAAASDDAHGNPTLTSRRAALTSGLATAAMIPSAAWASRWDSADGSSPDKAQAILADLEEKKEKAAKKKEKKDSKSADVVKAEEDSKLTPLYGALALGGLSVPFFAANLGRLGTKVASGGKDDGYGGPPRRR